MSDDHLKLIAKIQHFYDFMASRSKNFQDDSILDNLENMRNSARDKALELDELSHEYSKVFQEFLYKDSK